MTARLAVHSVLPLFVCASALFSQTLPFQDPDLPLEGRVRDLISRMTLDEKVRQTLYNAPEIPRLGIPAYNWWSEALHGVARAGRATVFPQASALAATFTGDKIPESPREAC